MTQNQIKENFTKFVRLQKSGAINMCNIQKGALLTKMTEEEYSHILFNYNRLKEKYGANNK